MTMTPKPSPLHNCHHPRALLASTTTGSRVPHFSYPVGHQTLSILSLQGKMTVKVPNVTSVYSPLEPPLPPLPEILALLPLPNPSSWTLEDLRRLLKQKKHLTFWNPSSPPKLWNSPNLVRTWSQMNPQVHQLRILSCRRYIVRQHLWKMMLLLSVLNLNLVRSYNPQSRRHPWEMEQKL